MASHDEYGKSVLSVAARDQLELYGASVEVDYGVGQPARIDAVISGQIAVEVESRVSKQVRGAVVDLICHPFPKKLLVLLPVHMSNPKVTAEQCINILGRFLMEDDFRVVVCEGSGQNPSIEADARLVRRAMKELLRH